MYPCIDRFATATILADSTARVFLAMRHAPRSRWENSANVQNHILSNGHSSEVILHVAPRGMYVRRFLKPVQSTLTWLSCFSPSVQGIGFILDQGSSLNRTQQRTRRIPGDNSIRSRAWTVLSCRSWLCSRLRRIRTLSVLGVLDLRKCPVECFQELCQGRGVFEQAQAETRSSRQSFFGDRQPDR